MLLGVPRGFFYYDYSAFIKCLFQGTDIELLMGEENDEHVLAQGNQITVDEACFPIKLFVGQVARLRHRCDRVLIFRIMKDISGRWLCPKLLGVPELSAAETGDEDMLITEPLYFNEKKNTEKSLWRMCRRLGMDRKTFRKNFAAAYKQHACALRSGNLSMETAQELVPNVLREGEIILPNVGKVLLTGHCYNVYDRFANGDIIKRLDDLGIDAVTDQAVSHREREAAVAALPLIKAPFWEALIRVLGTAIHLRDEVEGIIYLSSFSCGPDAFIVEMLKKYVKDIPILVLKLDEHRGEAGYETRIEAFADLLEKRRAS